MKNHSALVHFDWAVKRLLRNKSNFVVLEGFFVHFTGARDTYCQNAGKRRQ